MTVFFRPCGDLSRAPEPRTAFDLSLYDFIAEKTGLPLIIDPAVDYEDWMEPVSLLEQALHCGLEIKVLPREPLRRAAMNPVVVIPGKPSRDFLIGRQLTSDPMEMRYFDLGWPSASETLANHYAELEVFQANAGRKLRLADMPGDRASAGNRQPVFGRGLDSTALGSAMADLAPGAVIIKQVYPGKALPLLSYDLDEDFTADRGSDLFFSDVGFHFARFEGDPAALLVQEKITMTHETRFFVIGGKVISGAACIESHTPQQTPYHDDVLPPVWERERNSGDMDVRPSIERKRTALQLWQYAWSIAEQIKTEAPELDAYTLDVALGADGNPLIIELNPASNAGLYANNAIKLFDAIFGHAQAAPKKDALDWNPDEFVGLPEPRKAENPLAEIAASVLAGLDGEGEDTVFLDD